MAGQVKVQVAAKDDLPLIVSWLENPKIIQWLDFGTSQIKTTAVLKLGIARGTEKMFVFSPEDGGDPAGIVGLTRIHPEFRTAMLWYALGEPELSGQGLTTRAVKTALDIAFDKLELDAINAWAVVGNHPSVRILEKAGFRLIGRQRRCHYIDGRPRDRLLFDRLSNRFGEPDG